MPDEVSKYIDGTRRNFDQRCRPQVYKALFRDFFSLCDSVGIKPSEISIVYSTSRRCEIIKINGHKHLIYDQYLGQTLNNLNRHFVVFKKPAAGIQYFHRILAEFSNEYDFLLPEATYFATEYSSGEDIPERFSFLESESSADLEEGLAGEVNRALYTLAQEQYIFVHELLHEIYSASEKNFLGLPSDFVSKYSLFDEFIERHIEGFEALIKRRAEYFTELRRADEQELRRRLLGITLDEYEKELDGIDFTRHLNILRNSEILREELFCDSWAAVIVAAKFISRNSKLLKTNKYQFDERFSILLEALYVGHFHLGIVNLSRDGIRQYHGIAAEAHGEGDFRGGQYLDRQIITQFRTQNLKTLCTRLFAATEWLHKARKEEKKDWKRVLWPFGRSVKLEAAVVEVVLGLSLVGLSLCSEDENSNARQICSSFELRLIDLQSRYYEIFGDNIHHYIFEMLFAGGLQDLLRAVIDKKGGSLDAMRLELDDANIVSGLRAYVDAMVGLTDVGD